MTGVTCTVYEFYDANDALLYVGVTSNLKRRLSGHRHAAPWFGEVARIAAEHFATPEEAGNVEAQRIRDRNPRYNVARDGRLSAAWADRVANIVEKMAFSVLLPRGLHAKLKALAEKEQRSLHGQIIYLLQQAVDR